MEPLTPQQLLEAYARGYFPMALNRDDPELYWFSPEERGVLPLDSFNIPRGLARAMKKHRYIVTVDTAFEEVIRACGTLTQERRETWINESIVQLYTALFHVGHAHSVEVWSTGSDAGAPLPAGEVGFPSAASQRLGNPGEGDYEHAPLRPHPDVQPNAKKRLGTSDLSQGRGAPASRLTTRLVGGLYGVSLGGAFFGESMFSRAPDASKIALVRLVEILREAGYTLLDTQYVNEHLKQFGVEAWSKADYMTKLEKALSASPNPSTRFSTASVRSGAASSSSDSFTSPS
jgi:Leu/Phe-tRNA-protein transferase